MLSTTTVNVSSTGTGLQVKAGTRGFEIVFDEPEEAGGANTGMNPVEGLLCALGACQSIATLIFAHAQGIDVEGVQMEVEGDLDTDGFMGINPNVRNGLQEVRFNVRLQCDDEEKARALAQLAEERCPVGDCLKNPVPVVCTEVTVG